MTGASKMQGFDGSRAQQPVTATPETRCAVQGCQMRSCLMYFRNFRDAEFREASIHRP